MKAYDTLAKFSFAIISVIGSLALPFCTSCARAQPADPFSQTKKTQEPSKQPLSYDSKDLPPLIEEMKNKGKLTSIHIIDFNGFSETITNKERLSQFENRNFLFPQQYKKVLRVFRRSSSGNTLSIVTSYHENGHIHRYLECNNGRASGNFREWYDNGQVKIAAYVIAGSADIDEKAIDTWAFDGESLAWTPQGKVIGHFSYKKGLLDGISSTYYPSEQTEWITEYVEGKKSGFERHMRLDGSIIEEIQYLNGMRNGVSRGYWPTGKLKYQEKFQSDILKEGVYYSFEEDHSISSVIQGEGVRSLFDDERLVSQYQISSGRPQGWIKIFAEDGSIIREYSEYEGKRHGKETLYYPKDIWKDSSEPRPKLTIEWVQGVVSGIVETWYPNGCIESRREMKHNERDGINMCWYPDGSVMLVEEYEKGLLMKGRYHRRGESAPCSRIERKKGTATIFDRDGNLVERIQYVDGKPVVGD